MTARLERLSLADVAKLAGVSPATASRALSGSYGVAPSTRQRVVEIARQVNYVVSPDASRLAGRAIGRVALIVPHIDRWFFGAMVAGLEAVLSEAGLDVLLYQVSGPGDRQRFFEQLPARRKVDAVVVVALPVTEMERERLESLGVTILAAGGQDEAYPHVSIDDDAAGRQAVQHLLHLRHRRIAMIAAVDPTFPGWPSKPPRSSAYFAAMAEADVAVDDDLVVTVDWGGLTGADGMARLLSLPKPPTAVYAHSDEVALGAMRTIRRAGLRIPHDISIIGIDDHPLAELMDLTTVHQPVHKQGVLSAQILLALLRGENVDGSVTVPTHLVVRGSTSPPAN
jgi:LacI family repressor for deo operon, udp, cdd, tsx, nupC, and nupG